MKTPRITDFDPDAKVQPLKSSMDNMPAIINVKRDIDASRAKKVPEYGVAKKTEGSTPSTGSTPSAPSTGYG